MPKIYLTALIVPAMLISAAIFTGCGPKQPEVIMAVPLCDCNANPEDPRTDCWEGYVCKSGAACSKDGGLFDKCVPEGSYAPHEHSPSY